MTISKKRKLLLTQLKKHMLSLDKSLEALTYSYEKCNGIGKKYDYDLEEQESFEALTARFARTSDILTQKTLKTFYMVMQEDVKSVIDGANLLEKLEVIENAEHLINIRELRNQIAHEYVESELIEIFSDVLKYVPLLKEIILNVQEFIIENHIFTSKTD